MVVAGLTFGLMGGEYSTLDWWRLKSRVGEQEADLVQLQREIDSLNAWADSLETDSATIERVARENIGMIRDGELQFRFETVPDSSVP